MLTDEFIEMCYHEYKERPDAMDFHEYVEQRLADMLHEITTINQ